MRPFHFAEASRKMQHSKTFLGTVHVVLNQGKLLDSLSMNVFP